MNHRFLLDRYPFEFIGLLAVVLAFGCAPTPPEVQPDDNVSAGEEAQVFETSDYTIRLVSVIEGLNHPYSFRFLPDGSLPRWGDNSGSSVKGCSFQSPLPVCLMFIRILRPTA